MAWSQVGNGSPYLPEATGPWLNHWGRRLAGLLAVVLLAAAIVGGIDWAVRSLVKAPPEIYMSLAGPLGPDMPAVVLALFVVITLVPLTFGLTLVLLAALVGVVIPFLREKVQLRTRLDQRRHGYSEAHDHIPESGFEHGIH